MNRKYLIINLILKNYWPKAPKTIVIIKMRNFIARIKHFIWLCLSRLASKNYL